MKHFKSKYERAWFRLFIVLLLIAGVSCKPIAASLTETRKPAAPSETKTAAEPHTTSPTIDKPRNWTTNGPWGGSVGVLVIDLKNPKVLYAGGRDSGVFRSMDGGESWTAFRDGLPDDSGILDLAIDPSTPSILYTGTRKGVYKSTDNGENWMAINNGLPSRCYFSAVAIDPVKPSTLYAGESFEGKLYKSIDGGARWSVVDKGLPEHLYFYRIAIDPSTPTTIYLANWDGLYKSIDGGETWNPADIGIVKGRLDNVSAEGVFAIVIDPSTPSTLYAGTNSGLYKSTNSGGNWSLKTKDIPEKDFLDIAIDQIIPTTLYAAVPGGGVFRSADGGETWVRVGGDFEDDGALDIEIDPQNPATLYAGTYSGVFKSTNDGQTWIDASIGLTLREIDYLVSDPLLPTTLYTGTYSNKGFKSTNGGKSWNATSLSLHSLVINPKDPSIMYGIPYYGGGVVKSVDGGNTWSYLNLDQSKVYVLSIDPNTHTTLYAAYISKIYKSTDAGMNWEAIDTGLPSYEYIPGAMIRAFAIDPSIPSSLYLGFGRGGIFKSNDGGEHWENLNSMGSVQTFAIDPVDPTTVYAGSNNNGIIKSIDGGMTWRVKNNGLPDTKNIRVIAIDPEITSTLYIGMDNGVYRSLDGGENWICLGLSHTRITALVIDPLSSILHAGTYSGVYSLPLLP